MSRGVCFCLFVCPLPYKQEDQRAGGDWLRVPAAGSTSQPRPPSEWTNIREEETNKRQECGVNNMAALWRGADWNVRPACERVSAGKLREAARASGIMAAVTVNTRRVMTHSAGLSERSGRVLAPGAGGGRSAETWKRDIVRQLKRRDLNQHAMFQDLIRFCTTDKYTF